MIYNLNTNKSIYLEKMIPLKGCIRHKGHHTSYDITRLLRRCLKRLYYYYCGVSERTL